MYSVKSKRSPHATQGGGWRPWRRGLLASNAPRVATGMILQQRPQKLYSQVPGVVENVPVAFCRAVHLPKKKAVGHPPGAGPSPGGAATSNLGHNCANPKPPGWQQRGPPVWFGGHGPSCARLRAFAGWQAAKGALWHRLGKFGAPRATAAPH